MESLHDQPEWCRVVLASIGDAVITTDTKGQITFLNAVAEFLTGWTQPEAMGQPLDRVFRIINEHSRQAVESPTVRALRDGVVVGLANHSLLIAKDGTQRPVDDSAAPIRHKNGEVVGVVLVFRDISERRRQEQHVQDALAYANNIIATLREPFLVLDKSLRVKTANRSFYQSFHVPIEDTEGRFVYDLGNGQWNIPRLRTLLEEVLPNNYSFHDFEVEHDFPAIGRKIMLLNACRFESANSAPSLILLAIEDVTERSRLERQTKEQAAELSDLHRRKDEFLAMLSHELRNPLASISNAVQMLRLQQGSENTQKEARTIIDRQVGQLKHLVDDLLEISRITTGRMLLHRERVGVSGILEHAVETARSLMEQGKHELTVSVPPEPIWLYADASRLEQVVVNLLTNAAKYTGEGGHVWLTVQQEGSQCVLKVRDTGVGIAPELLPRSSTCSRRPSDHWTARKAGWASDWLWCDG